jgi:hypothetical protein
MISENFYVVLEPYNFCIWISRCLVGKTYKNQIDKWKNCHYQQQDSNWSQEKDLRPSSSIYHKFIGRLGQLPPIMYLHCSPEFDIKKETAGLLDSESLAVSRA